jgi:hypothetical protein
MFEVIQTAFFSYLKLGELAGELFKKFFFRLATKLRFIAKQFKYARKKIKFLQKKLKSLKNLFTNRRYDERINKIRRAMNARKITEEKYLELENKLVKLTEEKGELIKKIKFLRATKIEWDN